MFFRLLLPLLLLLAPAALLVLFRMSQTMRLFHDVTQHAAYQREQEQCEVLPGTENQSFEDFRFVAGDWLVATNQPILAYYHDGPKRVGSGRLVAVNLQTREVRPLALTDFPAASVAFRPHGMDFTGTHILVLNHADEGEDRIERFAFDAETVQVKWEGYQSLRSVLPFSAGNAVTKAGKHVYVTQWLPEAMYFDGQGQRPNKLAATAWLVWDYLLGPATHLRVGRTKVHCCTEEEKEECKVVADGFAACNGIASARDGSLVFVVDLPTKRVHVFDRDAATGALTFRAKSPELPSYPDNVALTAQEEPSSSGVYVLSLGSIADIPQYFARLMAHEDGRFVASSLVEVRFNAKTNAFQVDEPFIHDGHKLHSTSTAARWKEDKFVLSGPGNFGGMLLCTAARNGG